MNLMKINRLLNGLSDVHRGNWAIGGAVVAAFVVPALAHAQEESDETIDELMVWGTQIKSSSVTVDSDAIQLRQADHLSDLLRTIPGVDVGGTHSINQRIYMRGLDDTDLEIRLDGANQSNFMYHHAGNLLINPDILKAVDLQVGANSIVNDGIGGAVTFETMDPVDLLSSNQRFGSRVFGSFHDNNSAGGAGAVYGRLGDNFDLLGYIAHENRGDYKDGSGQRTQGNDGELSNVLVKGGLNLGETQRIELSFDRYQDEGDYPYRTDMGVATNTSIDGDTVYPTEYDRDTLSLSYSAVFGGTDLKVSLYENELNLFRDERQQARTADFINGTNTNSGIMAIAQSSLDAGNIGHALTYGARAERNEALYLENFVSLSDENATRTSIFVEDRIDIGDRLTVTPGIKYVRFEQETVNRDGSESDVLGALGVEWGVSDTFTLHASATELFKGPELAETFIGGGSRLTPNPDIEPETGLNSEAGFRYQGGSIGLFDSVAFGFTYFVTDIDNKIEEVGVPTGVMLENVGTLRIDGFEANVALHTENLGFFVGLARADTEIRETDLPLDRELGDSVSVVVDYDLPVANTALHLNSIFVMKEDRVLPGADVKPGYQVHNVSASWAPGGFLEGARFTLGVDNLFDEHYASHASRNGSTFHPVFGDLLLTDYEPGRNVKATFSYQF